MNPTVKKAGYTIAAVMVALWLFPKVMGAIYPISNSTQPQPGTAEGPAGPILVPAE